MDLGDGGFASGIDPGRYCREIETYLCRKNDGHLIRIAGPAFELVSGWAEQGIPLRVAFEGIDRLFERYYRKGPRRRPVHISFCDNDVQDVFDAWRRATGVPAAASTAVVGRARRARRPEEPEEEDRRRSRASLTKHLERTIAAITARRPGAPGLDDALDQIVRELDLLRAGGRPLRGEARAAAMERLRELDARLSAEARAALSRQQAEALAREADESLAPFRGRMADDAWQGARDAAVDRAARAALGLPVIAFQG